MLEYPTHAGRLGHAWDLMSVCGFQWDGVLTPLLPFSRFTVGT